MDRSEVIDLSARRCAKAADAKSLNEATYQYLTNSAQAVDDLLELLAIALEMAGVGRDTLDAGFAGLVAERDLLTGGLRRVALELRNVTMIAAGDG